MSTFPMQSPPNHFFPSSTSASSTSHYQFPQYWYNNPPANNVSFASPVSSPGKRKRDGSFDEQDSSSSDDGGPNYNKSSGQHHHRQWGSQEATSTPPPRPMKRARREWVRNDSLDDTGTGLGGTRPAGMENGFARMTLLNPQAQAAAPAPFVQEPISLQPSSESFVQPATKEVHMKTRSWYEPEKDRIVVLDLDGSDTESESSPDSASPSRSSSTSPDGGDGYTVSQAYLSRIKGVHQHPVPPPHMNQFQASSLILYKSLPSKTFHPDFLEERDDDEPLDYSHPNYVLPKWGPISYPEDRPLYASIQEVDEDDDTEMMEVDGN